LGESIFADGRGDPNSIRHFEGVMKYWSERFENFLVMVDATENERSEEVRRNAQRCDEDERLAQLRWMLGNLRIAPKVYHVPNLEVIDCNGSKCRGTIDSYGNIPFSLRCTACHGDKLEIDQATHYNFDDEEVRDLELRGFKRVKDVGTANGVLYSS